MLYGTVPVPALKRGLPFLPPQSRKSKSAIKRINPSTSKSKTIPVFLSDSENKLKSVVKIIDKAATPHNPPPLSY